MKAITAADALVVEHDSLVAAELKLLQRSVARQDGGFGHREEDLGQQRAGQAGLFKQLEGERHTRRGRRGFPRLGWLIQTGCSPQVSTPHLQVDALGTVDDLEVEDLAKVHPEV